jgi:hypothetical protein
MSLNNELGLGEANLVAFCGTFFLRAICMPRSFVRSMWAFTVVCETCEDGVDVCVLWFRVVDSQLG